MKSTKFLTKSNILKLAFESALIIFSVLLALFLNEYRGQIKDSQQKKLAMQMVEIELKSNLEIINEWRPYHEQVLKNLNEELESNFAESKSLIDDGVLIEKMMPQGVIQRIIDNGSWQTLKASNISSTIDFKTMLTLSKLYKLQSVGVETTLNNILEILSSRESLDRENLRTTIVLLRNAYRELVSQEIFLIDKYQQALTEMGMQQAGS